MVRAQAVARIAKDWDMQRVADKNPFLIEADDSRAPPKDTCIPLVGHLNAEIGDTMVRHKGRPVRNYVVSGARVYNDKVVEV